MKMKPCMYYILTATIFSVYLAQYLHVASTGPHFARHGCLHVYRAIRGGWECLTSRGVLIGVNKDVTEIFAMEVFFPMLTGTGSGVETCRDAHDAIHQRRHTFRCVRNRVAHFKSQSELSKHQRVATTQSGTCFTVPRALVMLTCVVTRHSDLHGASPSLTVFLPLCTANSPVKRVSQLVVRRRKIQKGPE